LEINFTVTLVVQKYGGSCMASPKLILSVAERIVATRKGSAQVIAVVSAMGGTTDQLLSLAGEISPEPQKRELDMLLTAGERVSMALLAMAINSLGWGAISFTGSQSGIITDDGHGEASIVDVKAHRIRDEIDGGKIVIVAGFQGVSLAKEVTTLGRGGSDLTAVMMAAAFGAERCELYKDVPGVFTADPRIVTSACRISQLSYDELLELIGAGSQVVQDRAVLAAKRFRVPLHIKSGFSDTEGTMVTQEPATGAIGARGVGMRKGVCRITIETSKPSQEAAMQVLAALASARISVHLASAALGSGDSRELTLVVDSGQAKRALEVVKATGRNNAKHGGEMSLVSLVGHRVSSPDLAAKALADLADSDVPVEGVCSTSTTLTCITTPDKADAAARAMHKRIEVEEG
jgi:aspartate kinase